MFFSPSDDDDGGGFSSGIGKQSGGSKLSSLFDMDKSAGGNESLKYNAPKQPKPRAEEVPDASQKNESAPSLMYACAVHAFRLVNGEYIKQGKLGAAILGEITSKDYKILLYISQKKPVSNAQVSSTFKFNVQKNNYATFYDDHSQNWSLCFDSESQILEFAKWVGVARYHTSSNALTAQDLNCVDGQMVQKGDTCEIIYTGWLLSANTFGKMFDSNKDSGKLFKFRVGKGKVIQGWDSGVIGMRKSMKRVIVIPPELAYGSKGAGDRVPPNATLVFQVEVTRVKFVHPESESQPTLTPSIDLAEQKSEPVNIVKNENSPEESDLDGFAPNESLKDRSYSLTKQMSKTNESTKTKLLERMSKMGHSMMPATPSPRKSTSSSESEEKGEETDQVVHVVQPIESKPTCKPESPKPQLRPKPDSIPRTVPCEATYQTPVFQHPTIQQPQSMALYQPPVCQPNAVFGLPQYQVPSMATAPIATDLNLMMTDGRLKHSEIKIDLCRILEKVDAISTVLSKIERPAFFPGAEMEAEILMQNITRIIKENEKLRTDCDAKSKKIELLNEKMSDLLTTNQQFFQRSNTMFTNQNESIQNKNVEVMVKVASLQERNNQLDAELKATHAQLQSEKFKNDADKTQQVSMESEIESLKVKLKSLEENENLSNTAKNDHEMLMKELTSQLNIERKEMKELKKQLEKLEEEHLDVVTEKDDAIKSLKELKKKRKEERLKFGEDIEELKNQHEDEIRSARHSVKKGGLSNNNKLLQLESDLKDKFDSELQLEIAKLKSQQDDEVNALKNENDMINEKAKSELFEINNSRKGLEELIAQQKDDICRLRGQLSQVTKEKHALEVSVKANGAASEVAVLKREIEKTIEKYKNLLKDQERKNEENLQKHELEAYDRGLKDGNSSTTEIVAADANEKDVKDGRENANVSEKIKKVMNSVFYQLWEKFEAGQSYQGEIIVSSILEVVKTVTLKMVKNEESSSESEEESSDEDDEGSEEDNADDDVVNNADIIDDDVMENKIFVKDGKSVNDPNIVSRINAIPQPDDVDNPEESGRIRDPTSADAMITESDEGTSSNVLEQVGLDSSLFNQENIDVTHMETTTLPCKQPPPLFEDDDDDTNWI